MNQFNNTLFAIEFSLIRRIFQPQIPPLVRRKVLNQHKMKIEVSLSIRGNIMISRSVMMIFDSFSAGLSVNFDLSESVNHDE